MISTQQIRSYTDALGIPSRVDSDGSIMISLDPDEDFGYPIVICILVEEGRRLLFIAASPGYKPKGDQLFLANRHNGRRYFPTAVVRDGSLRFEYSFLIEEEVSEDYIRENCVHNVLSAIWTSFCEFESDSEPD